ncbi:MAG TPA: V-type ATP synthase subunit F [Planctomycetota bacterium]|nr:V-type ATP synthase subunit F [Planctomycetota bacterium]
MSDIVAIGEKDQIIGFRGVGVRIAPVKTNDDFVAALADATRRESVSIVLLTESYAGDENAKLIAETRRATGKVIVVIPDHHGSKGLAFSKMRADVERALGVDLLSKAE